MELKSKTIEDVLDGSFDVHKAAAGYETEQKNEAQLRACFSAMNKAMRQKQWDEAQAKFDEAQKFMSDDQRDNTQGLQINILFGKEEYPAAYKLVTQISEANKENSMLQNELAWQIATDPAIKERDLKVAELCANRANDATHGKDPGILDTVARVKFMQGKKDEAIGLQEKAVNLADSSTKTQYERTLEAYKRGELTKAD
jgi:tetratricopeptide (TPR) repeat protein